MYGGGTGNWIVVLHIYQCKLVVDISCHLPSVSKYGWLVALNSWKTMGQESVVT